jgi:hypothetical protein
MRKIIKIFKIKFAFLQEYDTLIARFQTKAV